jgi:hypothetical protein
MLQKLSAVLKARSGKEGRGFQCVFARLGHRLTTQPPAALLVGILTASQGYAATLAPAPLRAGKNRRASGPGARIKKDATFVSFPTVKTKTSSGTR